MFLGDDKHLTDDQREQREIHVADCLAVTGREYCGYECMKCGLCTKWSHGRHKAPPCACNTKAPLPCIKCKRPSTRLVEFPPPFKAMGCADFPDCAPSDSSI